MDAHARPLMMVNRRIVARLTEWISVAIVVAGAAYFVVVLLTGFSMDYIIDRNPVLVWSGAVGAAGISASHGWVLRCRDTHPGGWRTMPGAGQSIWALVSGAVLWLIGVWVDSTRLNRRAVEYGELVPRDPLLWPIWVPAAVVAAGVSLLYARRRGVLRWALWSLPLQALWWAALLTTV